MNSLEGGIGQVISIILQSIFVQQHFSPGLVVLLSSEAGNVRLFFKLGVFIQDGTSHKYCFSCKGDSGIKCCLLRNVTASKVSDEEDPESAERSHAFRYNQLRVYSDEEILGAFDRLEQKKTVLSAVDFGRKSCGCHLQHPNASLEYRPQSSQCVAPSNPILP